MIGNSSVYIHGKAGGGKEFRMPRLSRQRLGRLCRCLLNAIVMVCRYDLCIGIERNKTQSQTKAIVQDEQFFLDYTDVRSILSIESRSERPTVRLYGENSG